MTLVSPQQTPRRIRGFPAGLGCTGFAAYRADSSSILLVREERAQVAAQAVQALSATPEVAIRGTYDTSGYRADVDLLVWLAAPAPESIQDALSAFRQTAFGSALQPVWAAVGLHQSSDLGKRGAPAYFRGDPPRRYMCVCEINHTAEWYALPGVERRRLQEDGDRAFRYYTDVLPSAVAAFGLGGSEALLALESHDLGRLVDLVRDLGAAETSRYIRGPLSFFTGIRKPLGDLVEALP